MSARLATLVLLILSLTLLAGCASPGPADLSPTPSSTPTVTATSSPSATALVPTLDPENMSPTAPVFIPPQPSSEVPPTRTPAASPSSAPPGPTSTAAPGASSLTPVIHEFSVTPTQGVKPGDTLTLTWRAEGASAQVCMVNYNFYPGECAPVAVQQGTHRLVMRWDRGITQVTLVVGGTSSPTAAPTVQSAVEIDLGCPTPWVFEELSEDTACPAAATTWTRAAAQPFARGWMVYSGTSYLIFLNEPRYEGFRIDTILDPLTVTGDTSSQVTPPAGFYAPASGFGIVWRGDAAESAGYQSALGWALRPEFGYQPAYQCWALGHTSTLANTRCYLTHPEGGLFEMIVSGGTHSYWQIYDG